MSEMHPQIKFQKQSRLAELQTIIDSAQAEMQNLRRELGVAPPTGKTPAQEFQAARDAQPNPFKNEK